MKWQFQYQGRTWEFDDSRLSMAEARLQKRITGGSTPVAAERDRQELDPDALHAALAIARKRAGVPLDEAVAIDDDDAIDLIEIAVATGAATKAAAGLTAKSAEVAEPVEDEDETAPRRARKTAS